MSHERKNMNDNASTVICEKLQAEPESSPHHAGEVKFLQSIAETGMFVIEGGSHHGATALAIAEAVGPAGRVYAFEPVPQYYAQLKENLSLCAENAQAYMLALGGRSGRICFYKHGEGSGITPVDGAKMIFVRATGIPEFVTRQEMPRLDLLHLDCEGSEMFVLDGARDILIEQKPRIFCEIHHEYLEELNQSVNDVVNFLERIGYDVEPVQVEDTETRTNFQDCSHIYAHICDERDEIDKLKKKISDLKARMPAHSVNPSMVEELEELEERLKKAEASDES